MDPNSRQPGEYYQLDDRMSQQQYGQNGGYYGGQPQSGGQPYGGYQQGYQQGGYQGYPPPQGPPPPQQQQQGYQQGYPQTSDGYGYNAPPPQGTDEKYSFEQAFKIDKPKWNDLWAAILVRAALRRRGDLSYPSYDEFTLGAIQLTTPRSSFSSSSASLPSPASPSTAT